jgi:c-di-GMP-binding flagellar brake protein YcgR
VLTAFLQGDSNSRRMPMNSVSRATESFVDDSVDALDRDQLVTCARLLAVSVAHHRAKFGVIPIASSSTEVARVPATSVGVSLKQAAANTVTEALAVLHDVSARAADESAEHAEHAADAPMNGPEKRRQLRLSIRAPVQICDLDGRRRCSATLRNISWGGAAVCCDERIVEVGERLVLLVPAAGQPIRIEAITLRHSSRDGQHEYGLRFDSLGVDDEERLLEVLTILMDTPDTGEHRTEVRLVQRLEVEYGDAGEFRATLEDISSSGMMLTVPNPHEIGDSIQISLSSADTPFGLNLRARVVHQKLLEEHGMDMYRVGLQFEHPTPQLRERISAVLYELATMSPCDVQGIDDDFPVTDEPVE